MKTSYEKALSLVLSGILCGISLRATAEVVWKIGTFDQSPSEFNTGKAGAPLFGSRYPKNGLVYVVGESNPANGWPGYQEAFTPGVSGEHPHPYTIQFDLLDVRDGAYRLKIGLLSETARVAALRIEINGHAGTFYQHPKLSYSGGDRDMVTLPIAATDEIHVDIPGRFLLKGTNRLKLTAVDEPTAVGGETHSGIAYDALELDRNLAGASDVQAITAEVVPTIFYVRHGAELSELVDVYVRSASAMKRGEVVLSVGGTRLSQPLTAEEFGEQKVEFTVPAFEADTACMVTIRRDGLAKKFSVMLLPAKRWNLLVVPSAHLDIGYTDYQAKVAEIQSRILDEATQLVHDHPDFRYSADGYWSVRKYMEARSEERQQQLFGLIRKREIFVPTVEANLLTGVSSLEVLIRSLYPAFEFHQRYGGNADYASITDVPTYSWSYESVMAAAGLKYFVAGSNMDDAPTFIYGRLNERSPFMWEGPDGSKTLMWYSWDYAQLSILFGGDKGDLAAGHDAIPVFLQAYSKPEYKSDSVLVYGSQWENTDLVPRQASIAGDWNKIYAYPHLQYSGFAEALQNIAAGFGGSVPVIRGTGGSYWEFGIASSAHAEAIARENEQRARAAEEFSTAGSLVDPGVRPEQDVLAHMWHNMVLYDEHTGDVDFTVFDPQSEEAKSQLATKDSFADDAKADVNYVLQRALANLVNSIYDPAGTLLVFNSLSWQRSTLVETDLKAGRELLDLTTNRPVPYQVLSGGKLQRHIRFLAQDVPSMGYKAYAMKKVDASPAVAQVTHGNILENQFYRITLDAKSGSVQSIFDKELNKELVNGTSRYKFDQYLYVTGGDQTPNRLLAYTTTSPVPELTVHNASGGHIVSIMDEPFGKVARLESSGVNTPKIETEILLFDGQKKIEFINHVQKTAVYSKEGAYFAFPLSMSHPQFTYETQNGFVDPSKDELPGAANEVFSVQHWIAANEDNVAVAIVPVDAPLVTLGDVIRGTWPREFGQRRGDIFSQVMNNYWYTNFALAQGGDFTFRYVVTSGTRLDLAYLGRLGREEMSPLEVDQITSQDKSGNPVRPLEGAEGSFLKVNDPDVALVTWKEAEDQKGTVLRFLEMAGKSAEVHVKIPLLDVKSAWTADAMERNKDALDVTVHGLSFPVKPFQIVTIRVEGTSAIQRAPSTP